MPDWISRAFGGASVKETPRRVEGITAAGAVVVRDERGRAKAEIPGASTKAETLSSDPLAIYKPDGAKHVSAAKALGNFSGWSYPAVNAIAREIGHIQWRLYQIKGKDHVELDDHELLDLLDGVNEFQTGIELRYVTAAHLELTGNAYWLLLGKDGGPVKSEDEKPQSIHVLSPGRIRVKVNKQSFPYKLEAYEYTQDGVIYRFQTFQVLQLRYPDPLDPFVGIGVPQAIPVWIDSDNYLMEYNRKFFLNGAALGLFIATQTNVEGTLERIKAGMKNEYAGVENSHKIPVMPKGVEIKSVGATNKDMDFANLADVTRDRILAAYGVSKTILGTAESDTNRSTAETADYVFSKRTIRPKLLMILSFLNERLVPLYGDDLYLTFIDPVPEDKAARTTEMQAAVANAPVMSVNEARKNFMGLGPVEGGDKVMVPAALTELGSTETPDGESAAPQLVRTVDGRFAKGMRVRKGGKTVFSASRSLRAELTDAFARKLEGSEELFSTKSVRDLTKAEYMEHYKRFEARTNVARTELAQAFRDVNRRQRAEVEERLPDAAGVSKALGDLFDLTKWIGITVDLATPVLEALTKDEAAAAFSMIGVNASDILAKPDAAKTLSDGIEKMARSYNETTLAKLKDTLSDKLSQPQGTSLQELTDAVSDVYDFADERRAGLIAKTEAFRAANWANKEAWQQSGVVKTLVWYTAEDATVCEFCAGMDGTEIDVTDNFFDEGDTVLGVDGGSMDADYGDIGGPPLHPDCRCYMRPGEISVDE